jgi:hypothetical protein
MRERVVPSVGKVLKVCRAACADCAQHLCIVGAFQRVTFPHYEHTQVDYATGELDRLRVLGPIDTKLFIGVTVGCCAVTLLLTAHRMIGR